MKLHKNNKELYIVFYNVNYVRCDAAFSVRAATTNTSAYSAEYKPALQSVGTGPETVLTTSLRYVCSLGTILRWEESSIQSDPRRNKVGTYGGGLAGRIRLQCILDAFTPALP